MRNNHSTSLTQFYPAGGALKLPVWHREEAFEIFVGDLSAIRKIASADRELL